MYSPAIELKMNGSGYKVAIIKRYKGYGSTQFNGGILVEEPFHEFVNSQLDKQSNIVLPTPYLWATHSTPILRSLGKSMLHTSFGNSLKELYLGWCVLGRSETVIIAKFMNFVFRDPSSALRVFNVGSLCTLGNSAMCFYSSLLEGLFPVVSKKNLLFVFRQESNQLASVTKAIILLLRRRLLAFNSKQIYRFILTNYSKAVAVAAARLNYS